MCYVSYPAQGMTAVQAAVGVVNHGLRPEIPRGTAPEVADLVRACWAAVPEQRPSFMQIEVQLAQLLDSTHRQHHQHYQLLAAAAAAAAGYQQHPHAGHYQQQGLHYQPHQHRHQQHHHNHYGRAEAAAVLVDVGAAPAPSPGPLGGPSMVVAVGQ